MHRILRITFSLAALALAAGIGCGSSNLGAVTGKVTLDGQPLPEAVLLFSPINGGSPSAGRTDGNGEFTLVYSPEDRGAEPGEHRVWIGTGQSADTDSSPPRPAIDERVPAAYRTGMTLKAEVKPGRNTINFELSSSEGALTSVR